MALAICLGMTIGLSLPASGDEPVGYRHRVPCAMVVANGGPGMKTILVPTQHIGTMRSALELAALLARRTGAYIEGFPLRIAIPPYVVAELTAGLTMDAYDAQRDEEMAELRRTFESFMQEHDIP